MTKLHLEVKIVDGLFTGDKFKTEVWLAEKAAKALGKFTRRGNGGTKFNKKLKEYATKGFAAFETENGPIRHERDGVWRVAHAPSRFRLIGFYETNDKASFVAIDAFTKPGQSLSVPQQERITEVARVKRGRLWKKQEP